MVLFDGKKKANESGLNFIVILPADFARKDDKSAKKDSQVVSLFCAFGICAHKSCS
jgi:hypothetical protein